MNKLIITKIGNLNAIVIKQEGKGFFISTPDSIIISIPNLATIIKYLVRSGMVSIKVLEGILSELKEE